MKRSKRLFALVLIALGLLLCAASIGTRKPKTQATPESHIDRTAEQEPSASDTGEKRSSGLDANDFTTPTPHQPTEYRGASIPRNDTEELRHDRREEALSQKLICLTGILAIANVSTLLIFGITMFANIRAANAAKDAAEASQRNNRIADQNMALQERAYLYLTGIRLMLLEDGVVEITYPILNAGHTPGTYTGEYSRAAIAPFAVYPEPIARGAITVVKKGMVVPPALTNESAIKGKFYMPVSSEEIAAIERREAQIVFHGFIRYDGIFGRWHDTGFGVAYSGQLTVRQTLFMDWLPRLGFNWFD